MQTFSAPGTAHEPSSAPFVLPVAISHAPFNIADARGEELALVQQVFGDAVHHDMRHARTAYIIHAVNCHADLIAAAEAALQKAEMWVHDQLDGTSSLDRALADLEPIRVAIAKARGASK